MTLRQWTHAVYANAVEEFKEAGLSLPAAIAKVDDLIRPRIPVALDPMAERILRAKQNAVSYARLEGMTGVKIGHKVKAGETPA